MLTNLDQEEILELVEPMMQDCIDGSNEKDHHKHTLHFTERMKKIVTPEELARQLNDEPRVVFKHREFVRLFRRKVSVAVVWKQHISGSDDELINQAIFVEVDGEIKIDHCMIC